MDRVLDSQFPIHQALADVQTGVRESHKFFSNLAMAHWTGEVYRADACSGCHQDRTVFAGRLDASLALVARATSDIDRLPQTPAIEKAWPAVKKELDDWSSQAMRMRGFLSGGLADGRSKSVDPLVWDTWFKLHQLGIPIEESLTRMNEALRQEAIATHDAVSEAQTLERRVQMAALLLGAVLMSVLAFLIGRSIDRGLNGVVSQATKLSAAARDGQLDVRGDEQAVLREFRPIIHGINETLDAMEPPIRLAIDSIEGISQGRDPREDRGAVSRRVRARRERAQLPHRHREPA